jgi:hypothetical protein
MRLQIRRLQIPPRSSSRGAQFLRYHARTKMIRRPLDDQSCSTAPIPFLQNRHCPPARLSQLQITQFCPNPHPGTRLGQLQITQFCPNPHPGTRLSRLQKIQFAPNRYTPPTLRREAALQFHRSSRRPFIPRFVLRGVGRPLLRANLPGGKIYPRVSAAHPHYRSNQTTHTLQIFPGSRSALHGAR